MNNHLLFIVNGWAGKHSLIDNLMIFCAKYLIYAIFLLTAVCIGVLVREKQWQAIGYFFCALATSYILLLIASHLYVDSRPFVDHHLTQLLSHAAGKSFPSDHTSAVAAIGFAMLFLTRFKKVGVFIIGSAALIGFSRVFVGVHYPIDIAGGLLVGFFGASLSLGIKRFTSTRLKQPIISRH